MNRRTLLRRSAPLASLGLLAGCLEAGNRGVTDDRTERNGNTSSGGTTTDSRMTTTDAQDTTTTAESDETTTTTDGRDATSDAGDGDGGGDEDDFSGIDPDADGPFRSLAVGNRDGVAFPENNRPRDVRVWNDADADREITVRVSRNARVLLDRTPTFPADAYLTVALNEPADYRVAVGPAGETPTTFRVERSSFDCNATTTEVGVASDGSVETVTLSTLLGCHGPEVEATDVSVGEGECGTANRASVGFDAERIRIEGTVRTPTPGADLELAVANYDADSDALTVRVRPTGGDAEPGVQCVGTVPYEAVVDFAYDLPGEVVVVHENSDGPTEVARVERGEA